MATAEPPALYDFNGVHLQWLPEQTYLAESCQRAIRDRLEHGGRTPPVDLPSLEAAAPPKDEVSIAYLVMAHRAFAQTVLARQLRVLWLALIHI